MMLRISLIFLGLLSASTVTGFASALTSITLQGQQDCVPYECGFESLPMYTPTSIYVTAFGVNTITGAEFRVTGLPPEWVISVTPNPLAPAVIGNPVNGTGVNIAFPSCMTDPCVWLFQITISANSQQEVWLQVEPRNPPNNPAFNCPLITLCDAPYFTALCVSGAAFAINAGGYDCTVAVNQGGWSGIKELYR